MDRDTFPADIAGHIRNLKDVIELNLTEKRGFDDKSGVNNDHVDNQDSRFICPVVGLEMSGKYKFFYSRNCGCVVSERALKEVKTEECHKCGKPFEESDLVVIYGSQEEVAKLRQRMEERREKAKAEKKGKKRKAVEVEAVSSSIAPTSPSTSTTLPSFSVPTSSSSTSASCSVKTVRAPSSTTKASTDALLTDKAKKDYSVAKDPNATETYKSLFTSHETAKKKPAGNWVTYNPLYF